MAFLKRKRSESELSFTSQLSSPPRPNDSYFAFPVAPIGFSLATSRASVASHLNSRTMKRHRDNRPSESEVHQHTLDLLYSGRDVPIEHLRHIHPAAAAPTQHRAPLPEPRQTSLHSFWALPRGTAKAALTANAPTPAPALTHCEDCATSLDTDDDAMDTDRECSTSGICGCSTCGKAVCFSCSVGSLADDRRCLMCAGRGVGATRVGWNGMSG